MIDGSEPTRISIRLADGEHFPIFRHGDPDTRNISLVPATEGQDEADIHFFYHASDGSSPVNIGVVRFPDLPAESGEIELQLDAVIGASGLLSVSIRHRESGRIERLEMTLPETDSSTSTAPGVGSKKARRIRWIRWIFGVLFVAAGLALVFWLTLRVTDWGRQDPLPPPVSYFADESAAV